MPNIKNSPRVYRIFDQQVRSRFPLPGLPVSAECDADYAVEVETAAGLDDRGFDLAHEWKDEQGGVIVACLRYEERYLLRFPDLADFCIQPDERKIIAYPVANLAENTLAHLLMDQVIPRVLGHEGRVITHASAVVTPNGHAIAFLGDSGRGKSTLASSFYQSGYGLVTDDTLLLELRDDQVYCLAAYPSLRLWPEAAAHLFSEVSGI